MSQSKEKLKHVYVFASVLLALTTITSVLLYDFALIDTVRYYFFCAKRDTSLHAYGGDGLVFEAEPKGYSNKPLFVHENKLLFLYNGLSIAHPADMPPFYELSFDVYPGTEFQKLYPWDSKIVAFELDLMQSKAGMYSLDFELNLAKGNRYRADIVVRDPEVPLNAMKGSGLDRELRMPPTEKMHFEILATRESITCSIDGQLVSKIEVTGDPGQGRFKLTKAPGSQFLFDNLTAIDSESGEVFMDEDFTNRPNLVDLREHYPPGDPRPFLMTLAVLFALGFCLDAFVLGITRHFGFSATSIDLVIPQFLLLLAANQLLFLSIEPAICVAACIAGGKIINSRFQEYRNRTVAA